MQLSSLQHLQASQNLIAASELLSSLDNYLQNTKGINTDNFVEKWKLHVREMLPLGTGEMHGSFPDYTLNVYWGGTNASTCIPPKAGKHGCLSQRRNTIWRHLA